ERTKARHFRERVDRSERIARELQLFELTKPGEWLEPDDGVTAEPQASQAMTALETFELLDAEAAAVQRLERDQVWPPYGAVWRILAGGQALEHQLARRFVGHHHPPVAEYLGRTRRPPAARNASERRRERCEALQWPSPSLKLS